MARLQSELVEARLQWQIELALVLKLQEQRPAFQDGKADKNAERQDVTPEMRSSLAAARGELKPRYRAETPVSPPQPGVSSP